MQFFYRVATKKKWKRSVNWWMCMCIKVQPHWIHLGQAYDDCQYIVYFQLMIIGIVHYTLNNNWNELIIENAYIGSCSSIYSLFLSFNFFCEYYLFYHLDMNTGYIDVVWSVWYLLLNFSNLFFMVVCCTFSFATNVHCLRPYGLKRSRPEMSHFFLGRSSLF